jgi:hypothetical protein
MSNPLESLFDQGHPRPAFVAESTANWRGYVAHWEIDNDELFLIALDAQVFESSQEASSPRLIDDLRQFSLDDLFPGRGGRIRASWLSGTLRIPYGKLVKYVHVGYQSRYERYVMLDVESGRLVGTAIVSNAQQQRQEADARLGKRLLKRFPRLWAAYSAASARGNGTQQVSPLQDLDDEEVLRRLENFLASIGKR